MSNQDESTSGHWLQRVYPYTICGGIVGCGISILLSQIGGGMSNAPFIKTSMLICTALGTVVGQNGFLRRNAIRLMPLWFRQLFKTELSKILGSIFAVFFVLNFIEKANLNSYWYGEQTKWEGILSGGWHGSIAVLMVLAGVVLWKLATKDAPKT